MRQQEYKKSMYNIYLDSKKWHRIGVRPDDVDTGHVSVIQFATKEKRLLDGLQLSQMPIYLLQASLKLDSL